MIKSTNSREQITEKRFTTDLNGAEIVLGTKRTGARSRVACVWSEWISKPFLWYGSVAKPF